MINHCPPPEQLRLLLTDQWHGPDAERVEAHLEECADCQQLLEQLTANTKTAPELDRPGSDTTFLQQLQEQPPMGTWPHPAVDAARHPAADAARLAGRRLSSSTEIQAVLRRRLLFIAIVTWVTCAIYAVAFLPLFGDALTGSVITLMLGVSGLLSALLWGRRPLSLPQLRWMEVILFSSMGLYFTWVQLLFHSEGWLARLAAHDWPGVWLMARAFSFGWYAIIVLYGILIPNTWRRCAVFVGIMAVWAVLLNVAAGFWDGPIRVDLHVLFVLESAVNMGLAAALATYGAHRIETLREQASQARKLGQYQLKERLGAGGMGEVYLAEHRLLRRPCAIKLIRPDRAGDPSTLRRFEREVQVMATLSHPNTVEIYDYGHAEDGTFYYVMEYLPGRSLEELVEAHGPLLPERAVHLLRQVCGALREAHGIGLVHRDVKPANILVCERGGLHDVAKLLDFGLVHVAGPNAQKLTQEGMIAGTPAYMSPEQAAGKENPDARSDIYSLGAVAYFLLTGQPPFVRDTAVQTLTAHLTENVPAPSSLRSDLPTDLEAIVLRCLEKEPARRFPDIAALEQPLAQCASGGQAVR